MAFSRLARQDRNQGIDILRQTDLLTEKDKQWAFTQFGLVSALNHELQAFGWYKEGKDVYLSDYNAAWRVRAALYQPQIDWTWVKQNIELMNPAQRKVTAWQYWHARATAELGNQRAAKAVYTKLSQQHDFYGQLAREALGQAITWPKQAAPVTKSELDKIKRNSGLQNAMALFEMGNHAEAVPEWNFAIQGLNDRELLAAAQWALNAHFYDRAINTSMLTKNEVNFEQRFPAPFDAQVSAQSANQGISPAWVYGLIRQESRFVSVARSRVGASGLMQLMPGTAKLVARKIGMDHFHPSMVNDFDINTTLGTTYLRMTMDKVGGSEVLATAGYNAGPNRAVRWQGSFSHPMEGAIFAETVPFTETRIYVKNVMSNAIWYDMKFNNKQPTSLIRRLGTIR